MVGLSVGAGLEHALNQNIRLRLEYIYDHYFDQKVADTEAVGAVPFFPETRTEIGMHTVRVGISINVSNLLGAP